MNIKLVLKLVGRVLLLEAAALVLPLAVALLYREDLLPFLLSIAIVAAVGLATGPVRPAGTAAVFHPGGLCGGRADLDFHRSGGRPALPVLRLVRHPHGRHL